MSDNTKIIVIIGSLLVVLLLLKTFLPDNLKQVNLLGTTSITPQPTPLPTATNAKQQNLGQKNNQTVNDKTLLSTRWDFQFSTMLMFPNETVANIAFSDGKIVGQAGCNFYEGTYTLDENRIALAATPTTNLTCQKRVMEFETNFFEFLPRVKTWSIDQYLLSFYDDWGRTILAFRKTFFSK